MGIQHNQEQYTNAKVQVIDEPLSDPIFVSLQQTCYDDLLRGGIALI